MTTHRRVSGVVAAAGARAWRMGGFPPPRGRRYQGQRSAVPATAVVAAGHGRHLNARDWGSGRVTGVKGLRPSASNDVVVRPDGWEAKSSLAPGRGVVSHQKEES